MNKEIIFTCLPHKKHAEKRNVLKISIAVEPHLKPNSVTTLETFSDMLDYAERIKNARFQIVASGNQPIEAKIVSEIQPELWSGLMHRDIRVEAFNNPDMSKYRIHSYPSSHIREFIETEYQRVALNNGENLMKPETLLASGRLSNISRYKPIPLEEIKPVETDFSATHKLPTPEINENDYLHKDDTFDALVAKMIDGNKFYPSSDHPTPEYDFARLRNFFQYDRTGRNVEEKPLEPLKRPEFEFHDILSIVSSYPQIQRKLGLVLDLEIELPRNFPTDGTLNLIIEGVNWQGTTTISCPKTAYILTEKGFYTKSKSESHIDRGFLKINTPKFSSVQIDVDGAAMKLQNTIEDESIKLIKQRVISFNLNASQFLKLRGLEEESPEEVGLPVKRSAGISITQKDVAESLHNRFNMANELQQSLLNARFMTENQVIVSDRVLYAEDIVQGYRMDVAYSDDSNNWFSLHYKKDEYVWFDSSGRERRIDDTEVDEGYLQVQVAGDPNSAEDIYISESIAHWEGWSLSVNRPSYAINEAESENSKDYVHTTKVNELRKYQLDPNLDFKLQATPKIVPGTLPKLRFGRKYNVRIRTVDLAGNSVDLKHQSENPMLCEMRNIHYQRHEPVASPTVLPGSDFKPGETNERMIIRSNFNQSTRDYESSIPLDSRRNPESIRHFVSPKQSQEIAEKHGKFDKALGNKPELAREMYRLITENDGLFEGGNNDRFQKVYRENQVELVYLPDPMAAGVTFFLAPFNQSTHSQQFNPQLISYFSNQLVTSTNTNITIPDDKWHKPKSIRIRLREGNLGQEWNSNERTLIISLPKGSRMKLRYSSWWRESDLQAFSAVWKSLENGAGGNVNSALQLAKTGRHWMVSPYREIELVHAVQQPLQTPRITDINIERTLGQTSALVSLKCTVNGRSTQHLNFDAQWNETVDSIINAEPINQEKHSMINEVPVQYNDQEIGRGKLSPSHLNGVLDAQLLLRERQLVLDFEDTKYRKISLKPTAVSRYQECFDPMDGDNPRNFTRTGDAYTDILIPSSARPLQPKIEYLIPTFEWRSTANGRRRIGGGIRVYLNRSWFSSGDGEMLAVVLPLNAGNSHVSIETGMANVAIFDEGLTHWGIDPIKPSTPANRAFPQAIDFGLENKVIQRLAHPSQHDQMVDIVAYPVSFDSTRKLWYADIQVNPNEMYYPFIKFTFARYQEHSIQVSNRDLCLSEFVQADYIQLLPERSCTVVPVVRNNSKSVIVRVHGNMSTIGGSNAGLSNFFEISVITAQPFGNDVNLEAREWSAISSNKERIEILSSSITDNKFDINKEISLPRSTSGRIQVIIQEYERGSTGRIPNIDEIASFNSEEDQPRLVYADTIQVEIS